MCWTAGKLDGRHLDHELAGGPAQPAPGRAPSRVYSVATPGVSSSRRIDSDTGVARPAAMRHARTRRAGKPGRSPPAPSAAAGEQAPIARTSGLSIVTDRIDGSSGPSARTAVAGTQLRTAHLPRRSSDTSSQLGAKQAISSDARDGAGEAVAASATSATPDGNARPVGEPLAGGNESPHGRRIDTPMTTAAAIATRRAAGRRRATGVVATGRGPFTLLAQPYACVAGPDPNRSGAHASRDLRNVQRP